jgi:xylulose-5-phosphate/fructose-6-phosphate phosphoketolase
MNEPLKPEQIDQVLSAEELAKIDRYWRAANYLAVGQIYLLDNPLLREPLKPKHVKPRLLGHWGTTPGLNFIYVHLNRVIVKLDLSVLFIAGPGHGGPALTANTWLEGSYTECYPDVTQDARGMQRLFKQFSFPGGIGSHVTPEVPGSIHEGGELGYSLTHAFGAAYDNPELLVACVIGDGEAETGALAASWHSSKFLNPITDGAVLPILHLNGYKIENPTLLARMSRSDLESLFVGYGYRPYFVEGDNPAIVHQAMASTLDIVVSEIQAIQRDARTKNEAKARRWPMIVLRTPKGWTGPKTLDGKPVEGHWRSHQVPFGEVRTREENRQRLDDWMKSYRPEELFDENGAPRPELKALAPKGHKRMGMIPQANGGALLKDLRLPDFRHYAIAVVQPGAVSAEATRVLAGYLRDVMKLNLATRNFRVMGPDETASNRLSAIYEVSGKTWLTELLPSDDNLVPDGRVMEVLSEQMCQGWLEGYLLSGRHGWFSCYEAFVHIVDSMFNQHAKWLDISKKVAWRRPIASLNYLLTSHVWRQDHNGFSHQDPGFIDVVLNKKADIVRVFLPPDANTLLAVADECLRSRNFVNVVVAGKQPQAQWLDIESAATHCARGLGVFEWASNDNGDPDVVLACAGDVPTLETLAAVDLLNQFLPELKVRVVNVVDLMTIQPPSLHPHGLPDEEFDALFTRDKPILFVYHGYPWLIHRLAYRRTNHRNLHVRGYKEEGTTTTPFDMTVRNDIDRFRLVMDVIDRVPGLADRAGDLRQRMVEQREQHWDYIRKYGEDMPEVSEWKWSGADKS